MTAAPNEIVVPTNEFQTPVTGAFLSGMSEWMRGEFMSCVESIPYVRWLIAPDRPRARDLPRDDKGRIIVDIAHPHILEDVDYFRPAAKFFEENGCYTFLRPNANPRSEYGRWLAEEWRRCLNGYVRKSDGEWVTGYMYWFLNYCRIMKTSVDPVSGIASRVEGFPDFWEGIYYRFHYMEQARRAGKHCIELSRRGAGKSFSFAAVMSHNLILGESVISQRNVMTALIAYSKEYLLVSKDGTLKKFVTTKDFVAANTSFPRAMLKSSPSEMSWEAGYLNVNGNRKGSGNTVVGVSIKDDESKIRGKRGIFLFEEMGSFSSLLPTYNNLRDSVTDGNSVFGQIYLLGTAGDAESDFSGAKTMLYAPEKYDILSVENVYDKAGDGGGRFGYFFPSYISRNGRIGPDGNSDVTASLRDVLGKRDSLRDGNAATYLSVVAQQPITPSEAILRVKSSFFDVPLITERMRQLDTDPRAHDDEWVGDLVETQDGVTFRPNGDIPIRQWPSPSGNSDPGALVIWEMPQKGPDGKPLRNRYIAGCDPYDNDRADSDSLFSCFVFDLFTDRLVAEYTGRKPFAEDCYGLVYRLCAFYNATCLYESNKKMMFSYFSKRRALWMLADCPEYLRDRQLVKYSMWGSSAKGVSVNAAINSFAIDLIRDWLKKPYQADVEEDGRKVAREVPNAFAIRSYPLLQELAGYDPGKNTDRVSALAQVMLYREQFIVLYGGSPSDGEEAGDDMADSEFFDRGWKRHLARLEERGF